MLSPRMAKVMLNKYKKDNSMKSLEPKYGWGHEAWVKELSSEIKNMHFDPTWTPEQVLSYVSKFVQSCIHQSPSTVNHERKERQIDN